MLIYRVFDWDKSTLSARPGGALYVPRDKQGRSRHDIPTLTGILYASENPLSPIVETIKVYRGQIINDRFFIIRKLFYKALVHLEMPKKVRVADLSDGAFLSRLGLRVADVISQDRPTTQSQAKLLFEKGYDGIRWPSALNSAWTNLSLFEERVRKKIRMHDRPEELSTRRSDVREAAKFLGVGIE